ncbi:MAG: DUF456 domain-containing protein [Candidatus Syntrophonatronum acetioxidans]|uniref:DUF456 domain-containing protein n=1 Tax=Candidatus Syntrophonatronum acetioxidans TaxID=1795816 RepID=A0A424YFK0_9FIRM|nr:MAG: DUF456 domain-containing protein [Candidatus Syntrophonatronum acetioxidans]
MSITGLILAIILFLLGMAGTILPALPGPIFILTGMIVYGLFVGFEGLTLYFYLAQTAALVLIFLIDYLAASLGTKRYGGSRYAVWGAAAGILVGLITLGPLGIIIGPFAGAVAAELLGGKELNSAFKTGFGTLLGLLGGTFLKLFIEIIMILWFFYVIL